jgi:hypothetical protein
MVGLTVMAFNGSSWIDTTCIAANVNNFPDNRGSVVGRAPMSLLLPDYEGCFADALYCIDKLKRCQPLLSMGITCILRIGLPNHLTEAFVNALPDA